MSDIQSTISATSPQPTPALGLALGGGVARGWAHIGVLQRFDELGIRPGIVCGTSVGALVGGFWLAGHLQDLEAWAKSLSKRRMLSYLDILLNGAGLIGGKKLEKTLQRYLPSTQIEDLPSRFAAVTTELTTGHEIWLRKGDLGNALQAAYALPGIFPPRKINDRWLIDGALVNPLPVSAARALDAQIVIAVGLHADVFAERAEIRREKYNSPRPLEDAVDDTVDDAAVGAVGGAFETEPVRQNRLNPFSFKVPGGFARNAVFNRVAKRPAHQEMHVLGPIGSADTPSANTLQSKPEPVPGLGEVMFSSFNIMMDRTTRSRLAADPADILITPKVSHVPLIGFDQADDLIQCGRDAVDARLDEIERALAFTGCA